MKKIFLITIMLIASISVFAQLKPYEPNTVLDKFVGTWVAKPGKKVIVMTIKKIQTPLMNSKADQLIGYVSHTENNVVLEAAAEPTLTLGINVSDGKIYQDKVFFDYFDRKRNKTGKLEVAFSKSDGDELIVYLSEKGHARITSQNSRPKEKGFTLPEKLTFKRQ